MLNITTLCLGLPGSRKSLWLFGAKEEHGSGRMFSRKAETESNALCSDVVEMRRVELLSEKSSDSSAPGAVCD